MLASTVLRKTAFQGLIRPKNGIPTTTAAVRSLATTPRSAATPDPDKDEDNILPVRSMKKKKKKASNWILLWQSSSF